MVTGVGEGEHVGRAASAMSSWAMPRDRSNVTEVSSPPPINSQHRGGAPPGWRRPPPAADGRRRRWVPATWVRRPLRRHGHGPSGRTFSAAAVGTAAPCAAWRSAPAGQVCSAVRTRMAGRSGRSWSRTAAWSRRGQSSRSGVQQGGVRRPRTAPPKLLTGGTGADSVTCRGPLPVWGH